MASNCRLRVSWHHGLMGCASSSGAVWLVLARMCSASEAEVASTTASNASPSTCHCVPSGWTLCTRAPSRICPPRVTSQRAAAWGINSLRSRRGNNRFEPPDTPNRASCSTRKNTEALARLGGVFRADTHKGSIKVCITRGERFWHSCATDKRSSQRKPRSRQPAAWRSKDQRSRQAQPLALSTPANASSGAGAAGKRRPWPSGKRRVMGMRSRARLGSTPSWRIRARVSW